MPTIAPKRFLGLLPLLWGVMTTGLALTCSTGNCHAHQRPNIILILVENISTDLSCYGCPAVKTPHIDKLASEGVRYNMANLVAEQLWSHRPR